MSAPTTRSENLVTKPVFSSRRSLQDEQYRSGGNAFHYSGSFNGSQNSGSPNCRKVEACNPEDLYTQLVREEQNKEKERSQRRAKALEYYANLERSAITIQRQFRQWRCRRIRREQALAAQAAALQRAEAQAAAERHAAALARAAERTTLSSKAKSVVRLITFWKTKKLIPPPPAEEPCSSSSASAVPSAVTRPLGPAYSLPTLQSPAPAPANLPRYVSDNHRTTMLISQPATQPATAEPTAPFSRPRNNSAPPGPSQLSRQSVPGVIVVPIAAAAPPVVTHTSAPVKSDMPQLHPPPTACLSNPDSAASHVMFAPDRASSSSRPDSQATTAENSISTSEQFGTTSATSASTSSAGMPWNAPQPAGRANRLALVWEEISFTRKSPDEPPVPQRRSPMGMAVRREDVPAGLLGANNSNNGVEGGRAVS